ncbi:hypothetical protein NQ315_016209 [Exocentrus adspersus]|uniref:Transposable element P transposase-like RNase H domain-containing protein n=1 Tax=Exocentrus adspersus TaxID=1586481 RepID=A0AAV8VIJ6_9CUCU|nr:hypothetical protein NQ315_016209 [Exocentrus adspersus]
MPNTTAEQTTNLKPFQNRFFASQLRNAKRKPQGKIYSIEDKIDALLLWKSSPTMYRNLNRLGFCLPTATTLRKLLRKVPLRTGISETVFRSIEKQVGKMPHMKRQCSILFDEMAIQPHLDYELHNDLVVGFEENGTKLSDQESVFMLRGVNKSWKQPVGFVFSKSAMSATDIVKYIKEIIHHCESIDLHVIAIICDQGAANVKAISLLTEESRRIKILNNEEPSTETVIIHNSRVVSLFDPPHLLKSIRNNLLTKDLSYYYNTTKKLHHGTILSKPTTSTEVITSG